MAGVDVVEAAANLFEGGVRCGLVDQVVEAHQAGDVEHAVVHLPALRAPRNGGVQLLEEVSGRLQPARPHVDPGPAREPASFGMVEQSTLHRQ
jgi:hypothetical protein